MKEPWINEAFFTMLVRIAGCTCVKVLLGYRDGIGPRCRLCNTVAKVLPKE